MRAVQLYKQYIDKVKSGGKNLSNTLLVYTIQISPSGMFSNIVLDGDLGQRGQRAPEQVELIQTDQRVKLRYARPGRRQTRVDLQPVAAPPEAPVAPAAVLRRVRGSDRRARLPVHRMVGIAACGDGAKDPALPPAATGHRIVRDCGFSVPLPGKVHRSLWRSTGHT